MLNLPIKIKPELLLMRIYENIMRIINKESRIKDFDPKIFFGFVRPLVDFFPVILINQGNLD